MTSQQRYDFYTEALLLIKEGKKHYICDALSGLSGIKVPEVPNHFPELKKFAPKNWVNRRGWWAFNQAGREKRISVLEECRTDAKRNDLERIE